jgi:hypothetical protein
MENVKGMLSAKVDGVGMIDRIMADLRSAGGKADNYRIIPSSATHAAACLDMLFALKILAFRRHGTGSSCWEFEPTCSIGAACSPIPFPPWQRGP